MQRSNHRSKEHEILTNNWGLVKQSVVLNHIVDPLIEKRIISVDQWMDLKNKSMTEPERMEELLYILMKSKPASVSIFLKTLRNKGYQHIADELDGKCTPYPPTTYIVEIQVYQTREVQLPDLKPVPVPVVKEDNVDAFNNPSIPISSSASSGLQNVNDSVRQTDLEQMKDEIKGDLRMLRTNLETERIEDRAQITFLQTQHTDLKTNFDNMQSERHELERKINELKNNVDQLKSSLASKEKDYEDIKRKNNFILEELGKKTDAVSKAVQEKEKEKDEIEKKLQSKNKEYKELQETLGTLKEDHAERLIRLKAMNKEKIRLEQNIKASDKEKKDLALQIKSLENKMTLIKGEHEEEINQIQQDLDHKINLISQLEKGKDKLERRLTEREESNNELRDQNETLLKKLHNREEENAIMRVRLQAVDLKKSAVPPYTTTVRGKNNKSTAQKSSCGLFDKR